MRIVRNSLVAVVSLSVFASCQSRTAKSDPDNRTPAEVEAKPAESSTPSMRDLDRGPGEHVTFRPAEIQWKDGPGSFEKGAQVAALEGDITKPGVFTVRFKVPDGFVINPHWHPNVERVTVLQGTLYLGDGDTVSKKEADALPAGTYTSMPRKMVHYAIAEGDTVIQLTSVGPWEINYVNPAHDPRKRDRAAGAAQ